MSDSKFKSFRTRVNKAIASATTLFLTLGAVAVGMTSAMAAPEQHNDSVKVSDIVLTDPAGNPLTEQLTVGDEFVIHGTWDATEANPQPGETFMIGLPEVFDLLAGGPPIRLDGVDPVTQELVTWATCSADGSGGILTCTFTDAVIDRDEIHGTFEFDAKASVETTEITVEFDLNGIPGEVELPGGGGIDDGITLPGEVSKSGYMNGNNWSMTWTVDIPGASLVAMGGGTARIQDTLGAGHALCDPIGLTVHTVRGGDTTNVTNLAEIVSGAPGDTSFAVDLKAPVGGFDSGVTYRVQYQTCTIDQIIPAEPTDFSNEVQIDGWGSAGTVGDTVTSRPRHPNVTKSGSVLGGADRNGKIHWTVVVPGDVIAGNDTFTLTETLGAGHEVGNDTISGIKILEQYGPDPGNVPGLKQDITDELNVTANTPSTASTFDLSFTIDSASQQTFKASDWRYIITYSTYLISEDLPEGGTEFVNSVEVNGEVAEGSAIVPDRQYEKTGALNTSDRTLDGVEHSAFTTMDWKVTIPGEKIDGLSTVTLTDTLSETHQVCEPGNPSAGVGARLGLHVDVQDQIANGGMQPTAADIPEATLVTAADRDITFELAAAGFSRDYQYSISYTTCTTSGGVDQRGTTYSNEILGSGIDRNTTVTMTYGGSGTGTGVARGSVAVSKFIAGPGAQFVPDGTTFDVLVEEFAPGATDPAIAYTLAVPLNGDPVMGLNQRGNGWTMRVSEPTFPNVPGVIFGTPRFAEGDGLVVSENGAVATAAITPAANISLELTNTAELGSLAVTKVVKGAAADQVDSQREYSFTAAIDASALDGVPAQADRDFTLTEGSTEVLRDLPIGAIVTVTEVKPTDDDTFTWSDPVVSPTPVTITAESVEEAAVVTVTNSVTRTLGTFTLSKEVTGAQADNPAVPDSVTVTATWQQEGEDSPSTKEIVLLTDGTPAEFGENLLIGTEVTLTETPLADGSSIAWGVPGWTGTGVSLGEGNTAVVTIGRDADAHVSVENHAATSTAGISLLKVLTGEATADVPEDAEFPVTATWTDAEGEVQSRDLLINASTPTPLGLDLPAGTVVTITEGERPEIATVDWGTITMSGESLTDHGDGSAQVVISDQQSEVTLISVTNEANWANGTFGLAKRVDGILLDDPDVPDTVEVIATWSETVAGELVEHSETISVPTDGSTVEFGTTLPAFTEVTLTEVLPADSERFTWVVPTWLEDDHLTVHEDGSATVIIQPAGDHELTLTNGVQASLGSLVITKQITGSGANAVPSSAEFAVTAEWTDLLGDQQVREVTVAPDQSTVIEGVPSGTVVTLTEGETQDLSDARWVAAVWSSEDVRVEVDADGQTATVVVSGERTAPVVLLLENEYDDVESLVDTGVDLRGILGGAIVLLGLGGTALMLRYRSKKA